MTDTEYLLESNDDAAVHFLPRLAEAQEREVRLDRAGAKAYAARVRIQRERGVDVVFEGGVCRMVEIQCTSYLLIIDLSICHYFDLRTDLHGTVLSLYAMGTADPSAC
jgi:hypothetical protein